ncbi:isopropylmalate/homocitrate/citramalate synthase [Thermus oshimai JL-2]|uniref:Isopropylmalate/homocitrate/citramalate synthase n=1 Tax=Thermus oshimai JL-2 TaxID=751945 RepID=K7QTS0_THEOS|nr:hydroxymethylglutaryl-CoA lyase [Thermus oshimai]AFV75411.1 isopropylmalate/homocitrate/citramalate synthase [Thermus oshimai JL-2]
MIRYVECPRDAWQGFRRFIPTEEKVAFLKALLEAGFRHLDLTSFVSPKWVPQMADAEEVLAALPPPQGRTYLAIVANEKGLERALRAKNLTHVGYPLSLSETFQRRNTNRGLEKSWPLVEAMAKAVEGRLGLVVYLSMAFGNPYGDPWDVGMVLEAVARLRALGVGEIALADTYGVADAGRIREVLGAVVERFGPEGIGAHLHARREEAWEKAEAALEAGVLWLEGALAGVGGCPFAGDELVGNLPTELLLPHLEARGLATGVDLSRLPALAGEAARLRALYA